MKRPNGFDEVSTVDETVDLSPSLLKGARKEIRQAKRNVRKATRLRRKKERKEKRRFTSFNRARRLRLYVIFAAIFGLAAFVSIGVFTPVMAVKKIEIQGTEKLSSEEIKLALEPLIGKPIALIDDDDVRNALKHYSLIEKYTTLLIPPETLSVVIIERTAALALQDGEEVSLVDGAGVITETLPLEQKPDLIPLAKGKSADIDSAEFEASARVSLSLDADLKENVTEIEAKTPFSVTLIFKDGLKVLWGDATNSPYKNLVLESILEATSDEQINLIDISSPKSPVFQ